MKKFKQNIETLRIVVALEKLIDSGVVKNWSDLARKYDYHPQKFTEVRGKRQNLPTDLIRKICADYEISMQEVFGYGTRDNQTFYVEEPATPLERRAPALLPNTILHVPVEAEAGFIGGFTTPVFNRDLKPWTMPGFDEPGYSFRVRGDSMFPTFKEGEIVVTGTQEEPFEMIKREYVYVVVTPDNILIKRIVIDKKRSGYVYLVSDNDKFPRIEIKFDQLKLYRGRRNVIWDLSKKYDE